MLYKFRRSLFSCFGSPMVSLHLPVMQGLRLNALQDHGNPYLLPFLLTADLVLFLIHLHLLRVLSDVRNIVLLNLITFAACNPQYQIVQRGPSQDIDVVAYGSLASGAWSKASSQVHQCLAHL